MQRPRLLDLKMSFPQQFKRVAFSINHCCGFSFNLRRGYMPAK